MDRIVHKWSLRTRFRYWRSEQWARLEWWLLEVSDLFDRWAQKARERCDALVDAEDFD